MKFTRLLCVVTSLTAEHFSSQATKSPCPCGTDQYCFNQSCELCPSNSESTPTASKIEDCLCRPGHFWERATETRTTIYVCVPCMPGTYKPLQGRELCQKCPPGTFSPWGSVDKENCTAANFNLSELLLESNEARPATLMPVSSQIHNRLRSSRRGLSGQHCCPGYFPRVSFVSSWGMKVSIANRTTMTQLPFKYNYSDFRISFDGKFALGSVTCRRTNGDSCSSSIHTINLTTFEDVHVAGNRSDDSRMKDGPGLTATFRALGNVNYGELAIAPDSSFALVGDFNLVRKLDLQSYNVSTFGFYTCFATSGMDISSDGSFAVISSWGCLQRLDLHTFEMSYLVQQSGYGTFKFCRIFSDSSWAIFNDGKKILKITLDTNNVTVLAGSKLGWEDVVPTDGVGTSAMINYVEGLAMSPAGDYVIFVDSESVNSQPCRRQIRRLDLASLAVSTLAVSDYITVPSSQLESLVSWLPCPEGSFSLAHASTCQLCPRGTFQDQQGRSSCRDCLQQMYGGVGASSAAECLLRERPGDGPCELPQLTWPFITSQAVGAWTGGLGTLMTRDVQVWACLSVFADQPAACREASAATVSPWSGPAAACYVYNERTERFVFWASNHDLRLVPS